MSHERSRLDCCAPPLEHHVMEFADNVPPWQSFNTVRHGAKWFHKLYRGERLLCVRAHSHTQGRWMIVEDVVLCPLHECNPADVAHARRFYPGLPDDAMVTRVRLTETHA